MKAIVSGADLSLDGYHIEDVALRSPERDEVVVRVHAAGVSFVDVLIATGGHHNKPQAPYIPGSECAGVIEAVGPGGDEARVGERVCVLSIGGVYAERMIVPAASAIAIPDAMTFAEAAVMQVSYITAYHALVERARIVPGETVMVLGAGGAVGSASVQLATALGAKVIASASTSDKRTAALAAGAAEALDSSSATWRDDVRKVTDGGGIDIVIDPVCGDLFEPAFRSLAWGGRHMVIGFAAGTMPALKANLPLLKGAALIGVESKQALDRDPGLRARAMACVFEHYRQGAIRPAVGEHFDFENFADAAAHAESRKFSGHTVLRIVKT